jgi:hypothetical protein
MHKVYIRVIKQEVFGTVLRIVNYKSQVRHAYSRVRI